jgi:hypothetical protein
LNDRAAIVSGRHGRYAMRHSLSERNGIGSRKENPSMKEPRQPKAIRAHD